MTFDELMKSHQAASRAEDLAALACAVLLDALLKDDRPDCAKQMAVDAVAKWKACVEERRKSLTALLAHREAA